MKPARISQLLLLAAAGELQAEFVAGDLEEEFADLARKSGRAAAQRWYLRQVLGSILPLMSLRMRSGELTMALLAALGSAAPLWALDRLWRFVYSEIPLKDGIGRAPGLLAVNLACLAVSAAWNGRSMRSRPRAILCAAFTAFAAGLALWTSAGATPAVYVVLALAAAPAGSLSGFRWRRTR